MDMDGGGVTGRAQEKPAHADAPAANDDAAGAARDEIRDDTAHHAADRAGRQRQCGERPGLLQGQSMLAHEVGRQPGHKELKSESGSEVAAEERQHGFV